MIRPLSKQTKQAKLPKIRRQYQSVFGLDGGLDYSKASTAIGEKYTPNCSEVLFRRGRVEKAKGTQYFSDTETIPMDDTTMHIATYLKTTGAEKLMLHTTKHTYAYNSTNDMMECVTRGTLMENCEDVWTAVGTSTNAVTTDMRKGSKSLRITIPAGFTTGVAAYEDTGAIDISAATYVHFYIKSSIALEAADLVLKISDEIAGGEGGNFEDLVIPALTAGLWTEVSVAIGTPGNYAAMLSVSLQVDSDEGACTIDIDDIMGVVEKTGDGDDIITSEVMNNYYISNNGVAPIEYWDMAAATPMKTLTGCAALAAKKIGKLGERLVLFHVIDTGTIYPRRVQWTIVGGISTAPAATDWTNTGSGDTDLESTMGNDVIMNAEKIGNYYVIYGEHTILLMDYTGKVSSPFAFYTRVSGIGLPAERGIVNLGNEHIFLGWDDIYLYRGGKGVERIGKPIKDELFNIISPTYLNRCFMNYIQEKDEIRLYYPTTADTLPTKYFLYNVRNRSWSRGSRSYTCAGAYKTSAAPVWDDIGDDADAEWDEMPEEIRWDDISLDTLAPLTLYGTSGGAVHQDNESSSDLIGVAIDGIWDTKDFSVGKRYRGTLTNWMEMSFEARGNNVDIQYSVNQGADWSTAVTQALTSTWTRYKFDFNANSDLVRFRFRNNTLGETFEIREFELGFIEASNRGM